MPLLACRTPEEFCQRLDHALSHDPQPLAESELRQLGWDAATDRLLGVLGDCPRRARMGLRDSLAWRVHKTVFSEWDWAGRLDSGGGCSCLTVCWGHWARGAQAGERQC